MENQHNQQTQTTSQDETTRSTSEQIQEGVDAVCFVKYFDKLIYTSDTHTYTAEPLPTRVGDHVFNSRIASLNFLSRYDERKNLHPLHGFSYRCTYIQKCNFKSNSVEKALRHRSCNHQIEAIHRSYPGRVYTVTKVRTANPEFNFAQEREINRTHLFSARLATLCKSRIVPLFKDQSAQFRKTYQFNGKVFTCIFSKKDPWTEHYVKKMKSLEVHSQHSIFQNAIGVNISEDLSNLVKNMFSRASETIAELVIKELISITGALANVAILFSTRDKWVATCAVVALLSNLGGNLMSLYSTFMAKPKPEADFTWIPTAISCVLLLILGGKNISAAAGMSSLSKASCLGLSLSGIGTMHRIFTEAWKVLYPHIHELIVGVPPVTEECFSQLKDFQSLVNEVKDFENARLYRDIPTSRFACERVLVFERKLNELFVRADAQRIRAPFSLAVRPIQKIISEWKTEVLKTAYRDCGTRVEPVVLHMFGGSGIGKSTITPLLVADVLSDRMDWREGDTVANHIYTRNPGTEYWSGYRGQEACVFDDFMQLVDSEARPSPEIIDVIRSANNAAFLVPMAEIHEKANSYFKSKLMILTTNVESLNPKSITCPVALKRRMDLKIKVTRPRTPTSPIDVSCYDFVCYSNDQETDVVLNYKQLVTVIRTKLVHKENKAFDLVAALDQVVKNPTPPEILDTSSPSLQRIINLPAHTDNSAVLPANFLGEDTIDLPDLSKPPPFDLMWASRVCDKAFAVPQSLFDYFTTPQPTQISIPSTLPVSLVVRSRMLDPFVSDVDMATVRLFRATLRRDETALEVVSPRDVFNVNPDVDADELLSCLNNCPIAQTYDLDYDRYEYCLKTWYGFICDKIKSVYKCIKDSIFGRILSAILSQSYELVMENKLESLAFIGTVAYGFYTIFSPKVQIAPEDQYSFLYWRSDPSVRDRVLSPREYARLSVSVASGALSPNVLSECMDIVKESYDVTGKTPSNRAPVKGVRRVKNEALYDPNCEGIAAMVKSNLFTIHFDADSDNVCASGMFVVGRCALVNRHVVRQVKDADHAFVRLPGNPKTISIPISDLEIYEDPEVDLALVVFPQTIRDFRDIRNHFSTQDDIQFKRSSMRIIVSRGNSYETIVIPNSKVLVDQVYVSNSNDDDDPDAYVVDTNRGFEYTEAETRAGDCGSPLLILNPRIQRKICGIHTAGTVNAGFAQMVVREHIDQLLALASRDAQITYAGPQCTSLLPTLPLENAEIFGSVEALHEPTKTTIRPSLIQGVFPVTKRPAILRRIGDFDPMLKGVQGFAEPKAHLPECIVENAERVMRKAFFTGEPKIARDLSNIEAVFGIPDIIEPVKTDTSPGYPWCKLNKPNGKRFWINSELQTIHPDLVNAINKMENDYANLNVSDPPIFRDSLKDERRPFARTDVNDKDNIKTRVFSACPMDFSIVLKKYFGAFFAHLQLNRIKNTTTIGVNPYSFEWQQIKDFLAEVSPKANDGDYEKFDTTEPPGFLIAFFNVARAWYNIYSPDARSDTIRMVAARQVVFALHYARGTIYRASGSLPSGTFGTTPINSGVNLSAMSFAFGEIFNCSPVLFLDKVRMVTHGDDNLFSVAPTHEAFTAEAIGNALTKVGMSYTSANKGSGFEEARPIEGCTFLKRGFIDMAGFCRAPLCLQTCEDMVNWIQKSNDPVEATIVNCTMAARELAFADPSGERVKIIADALLKRTGVYVDFPTTKEVIDEYRKFF